MADVTMPRLSDTMEEGKILRWLKRPGDAVLAGEILAEVETDKADMELEAAASGRLSELRLAEGEAAPVGAVIAVIEEVAADQALGTRPGTEAAARAPSGPPAEPKAAGPRGAGETTSLSGGEPAASPVAARAPRPAAVAPPPKPDESASGTRTVGTEIGRAAAATVEAPGGSSGVVRVRPPARLAGVRPAATASAVRGRRVPLGRMRASVARRMAESKREAPHFYLTSLVDMERSVDLRASLRALGGEAARVTLNHIVLKAVADALAAVPELNARFAGDAVELLEEVNLGIVTAVEEGLIVPVVHGADRLSLLEVAARARELGERAASGGFGGDDLSGATFSVSNLGMFGVESFAAVINPPHAAILAVGSVERRPVVRGEALAIAHTMAMTLSCDHRAVDGVIGARFLGEVKRRLESPVALLLPGAAG